MTKTLEKALFFVYAAALLFFAYVVWHGLPLTFGGWTWQMKNFKKPFLILLFSFAAWKAVSFRVRGLRLSEIIQELEQTFSSKQLLPALLIIFTIIFTWQQVTEYLSLQINFLPFSFYDYMLFYYLQGKIHYTGLLHTWYHINNLLMLLAPVWALIKSPLLLVGIYGPLACLGAIPLYGIAKERFASPALALMTAFIFLNYRYMQNILRMNFCVEILYPLFIFWAVYEAMKARWGRYYLALALGLLLKEDAFFYFAGVGALVFFIHHGKPAAGSARLHAAATVILGVSYYFFITRWFIPVTGNTVLSENFHNFGDDISSEGEFIVSLIQHPLKVLDIYFGDPRKIATYVRLISRLAFLPLFSPALILLAVPLFPLFTHSTGKDTDFYELHFHYAAAVIPFVFLAFTFGFSNLYHFLKRKAPSAAGPAAWLLVLVLLVMNGGHFRTEAFTAEDLKSIRWASELPKNANVVTHGHLLPYIGYREYNYYFAQPWDRPDHPMHAKYAAADYYLFDMHVHPYPFDRETMLTRMREMAANRDYELVVTDGTRSLFKRKS